MASSLREPMRFERAPLRHSVSIRCRAGKLTSGTQKHRVKIFSRGVVETGGPRAKRPLSQRNQTPIEIGLERVSAQG